MIKKAQRAFGLPTKLLKIISSEQPHAAGHDEWLLDEALAETFPASDPIAVTPIHLPRASPPPRSREVEGATNISDRKIGRDKDAESEALDTPIECSHCHTEIAATVALNFEGADYIYHFCGPQCLEAWRMAAIAHDK
ncbi:MAG TPA: DUF3330 domain-containing protein [Burkholderiaceae bacterium]